MAWVILRISYFLKKFSKMIDMPWIVLIFLWAILCSCITDIKENSIPGPHSVDSLPVRAPRGDDPQRNPQGLPPVDPMEIASLDPTPLEEWSPQKTEEERVALIVDPVWDPLPFFQRKIPQEEIPPPTTSPSPPPEDPPLHNPEDRVITIDPSTDVPTPVSPPPPPPLVQSPPAPPREDSPIHNPDEQVINPEDQIITINPNADVPTPTSPQTRDPLVQYAWHLFRQGPKNEQEVFGSKALEWANLNLDGVSEEGESITVGISDGMADVGRSDDPDAGHPDIRGNVWFEENRNYQTGSRSNSWKGDPWEGNRCGGSGPPAHGTAVTGLLAAVGGNGIGFMGVAPKVSVSVFNYICSPQDNFMTVHQLTGPFRIFNQSFGTENNTYPQYLDPNELKGYELGVKRGSIYVKASGNDFYKNFEVCNSDNQNSHPYVIVVSNVAGNGRPSRYTTFGSCLLVSAPGGGDELPILSTFPRGCFRGEESIIPGDRDCHYGVVIGSSFSTPMVSGCVARMLAANGSLNWRGVKHILISTARKVNPHGPDTYVPSDYNIEAHDVFPEGFTWMTGWRANQAGYSFHPHHGFGFLNCGAAVEMARNFTSDLGNYVETVYRDTGSWYYKSVVNKDIPDYSAHGVRDTINVSEDITIESVQVKVSATHDYIGQLAVELKSPSGTRSILLNAGNSFVRGQYRDFVLLSNEFYAERSPGPWEIALIDPIRGKKGTFSSWEIKINGRGENSNLNVYAKQEFCGGSGTRRDPFQICTGQQLSQLSRFPQSHFILKNGIDMASIEWTPPEEFKGTFYGNSQTISNLRSSYFVKINRGKITNLNFQNIDVDEAEDLIFQNMGNVRNLCIQFSQREKDCYSLTVFGGIRS